MIDANNRKSAALRVFKASPVVSWCDYGLQAASNKDVTRVPLVANLRGRLPAVVELPEPERQITIGPHSSTVQVTFMSLQTFNTPCRTIDVPV